MVSNETDPGRIRPPGAATGGPVDADRVDVFGTPVAVRCAGTGPPLLFLHGAGLGGRWLRVHEALATRRRVIAADHVGFGATPMQEWLSGFDDLVLHYDDLRRTLGVATPFDLVGHSLGGWLAAEYAVTYPDQVRSLTLVTPMGLPAPGQPPVGLDPFGASPEALAGVMFHDLAAAAEIAVDLSDPDTVVRQYGETSALARLIWSRPYSQRLSRRLRRITCPTLVVTAEHDRFVPHAACARYAELIPDARTACVPDAGHAVVVERPTDVARIVLDFAETAS